MKTIFKSRYFTVMMHQELRAFELKYQKDSTSLFGEAFEKEIILLIAVIEENQPTVESFPHLLVNTIEGGPMIEPDVQAFMHSVFCPQLWEVGIRTKAYCLGADVVSKMSFEFTVENAPDLEFQDRFFESYDDANEWLKSLT